MNKMNVFIFLVITFFFGRKNYSNCKGTVELFLRQNECKQLSIVSAPLWPVVVISELIKLIDTKKGV